LDLGLIELPHFRRERSVKLKVKVKVKVKLTLEQTTKVQRGSRFIALLFL
jgi:hypothetical protein